MTQKQRRLGAYYTPDEFALEVTRWALAGRAGRVLDPSVGGGAFLRAAQTVLNSLGVSDPGLLCGVDVDKRCIELLRADARWSVRTADFLGLAPSDLGAAFMAVVGNPPFVRHHWLKGRQRARAHAAVERLAGSLPRTASYWAYFVLHGLEFLADDGRLGLFVPEAILQSDYAAQVRERLRERFRVVRLIHVRERLFTGTPEPVVLIAADGTGPGRLVVSSVKSAKELPAALEASPVTLASSDKTTDNGRCVSRAVLDSVEELTARSDVIRLGQLATIRIGFVTGANHYFLRSRTELRSLGIPAAATMKVVGRTQWLKGLEFTSDDHERLTGLGRRTLLVRPAPAHLALASVKRWIAQGRAESIHLGHKCSRREQWFRVPLSDSPDAIATCTRLGPPLLVLNPSGCRCTNALHAISWREPVDSRTAKAIAVGVLTSLCSTWFELNGRRYGGGVLKVEPGALANAPVPVLAQAADAFDAVSRLLRRGEESAARDLADDVVLRQGIGLPSRTVALLAEAQRDLSRQRHPAPVGALNG